MSVHFLVPAGFADRPSGGNVYDRQLLSGWEAVPHEVGSVAEVAAVLARLPEHAVVLADSLVGSYAAEVLLAAPAPVVPLVHMIFGTPGEAELLAGAPVVITTSRWTRRQLVEQHAIDGSRVRVAVPGVQPAAVVPGTATGGELLCVAAVVPAKGHDVLLDALTGLRDLDWRCTLVGALDRDVALVDELTKAVADAGLADRVLLVGELVGEDLHAAYGQADLLVLPSRAETYAMVVTEALARGLPVVASGVGGVPEALGAVAGDAPGLLVPPGDADALAGALRGWLGSAPTRERWRRLAAERRPLLPTWTDTVVQVAAALEGVR